MKKIGLSIALITLVLSCILLVGCGGQSGGQSGQEGSGGNSQSRTQTDTGGLSAATDTPEYHDIFVEQELLFQWEQKKEGSPLEVRPLNVPSSSELPVYTKFIGMQFYQGEPVQLWIERFWHDIASVNDLCLYRTDGSREVLIHDIDEFKYGYLDQEGNLYYWMNSGINEYLDGGREAVDGILRKYLASGEILFEETLNEVDILDMRQTPDGRLYLIIGDIWFHDDALNKYLAEMDPATGLITKLCNGQPMAKVRDPDFHLGAYGEKPAAWTVNRIVEINADNGTASDILSLQETSYLTPEKYPILQDFRILEDESVEVLWAVSDGSASLRERLRMSEVEKTPILLRAWWTGSWLEKQVNSFNQRSETYYVIIDRQGEDREDLARLTSVQIATGKGPDLLIGDLMQEYIPGMIEKGTLEDLRPYLEESGNREEDYLPYVFAAWRTGDRIYGVNPTSPWLVSYSLDSSFLGGTEEPDIETLVNVLLAGKEDAVFLKGYDSQALLDFFLKGTDTLWGMVDWEGGSCDFTGELFAGILETARRYGDNNSNLEKPCIASRRNLSDIFHFDSQADRKRDGKVVCGVLFDDGCHAAVNSDTILAINANSANKEGAWEFLSFLLEDETQFDTEEISTTSRKAFDIWVEKQKEQVADGRKIHEMRSTGRVLPDGSNEITEIVSYSEDDITEERIGEYLEILEDARVYPFRTSFILDIIREEEADYFNGSKSAEAVSRNITNRVQLYLDERQ